MVKRTKIKNMNTKNMKTILLIATLSATLLLGGCASSTDTTADTSTVTTESTVDTAESTTEEAPGEPPTGEVPIGEPPTGEAPGGEGGFNVESGSSVETTGVLLIDGTTESEDGLDLTSTESNESTIKVTNGGSLTVTNSTLNKASGEMTVEEASDFFGANAGVLADSGSTLSLEGVAIATTASGGNAVFATGEGTVINLKDVTITTTGDHSRGLDATYTATINAEDISISTEGAHCAALATDRGEGTVTVVNGILNTSGEGSPCVYSTGAISVTDSTGTAIGSGIAVVEGKNSITLDNCQFTANAIGRGTGGVDNTGVMLYQSMSGDASDGTSSFTSTDSTLEILADSVNYETAPMFFVTNTDAIINLTNNKLIFGSRILLNVAGNDGEWGTEGSNGGNLEFTANEQNLEGNITVDAISTLALSLSSSTLTSTVNTDNTAKEVTISLDKNSTWNVTGTSYVTAITNEDITCSNIISNGNTIYYDATNSANAWLDGVTITLSDGGTLTPAN